MTLLRRLSAVAAVSAACLVSAAPSSAVVGGHDAAPGAYPAVAEITLGNAFLCTGTLVAPTWVLTAGHCGSVTAAPSARLPLAAAADHRADRFGHARPGRARPGKRAIVQPNFLASAGYGITLVEISTPRRRRPRVVGAVGASLWAPGTMETIIGCGTTTEGGDTADTLLGGAVRITTDAYCAGATATSTRSRWSATASRRAASTPARATPAARCSATTRPAR